MGDPDQAIYEFNGARPDLFDTFGTIAGAVQLPLASSQRCPPAVAIAATHLKDSGGMIGAAQGLSRTGTPRAIQRHGAGRVERWCVKPSAHVAALQY